MRDHMTGYMNPFVATNEGVAKRDFKILVNDRDQKLAFNPQDFDLYKLGEFDTETGKIKPCEPDLLVTGLSVFKEN